MFLQAYKGEGGRELVVGRTDLAASSSSRGRSPTKTPRSNLCFCPSWGTGAAAIASIPASGRSGVAGAGLRSRSATGGGGCLGSERNGCPREMEVRDEKGVGRGNGLGLCSRGVEVSWAGLLVSGWAGLC